MAKELYIYSPIYDETATTAVSQLNEVSENEDLTIRINTPGGRTNAGWSIINKLSERKSPTTMIVDGDAMSMGAMMLLYGDNVIANDMSRIMFHKAAYPSWYEASEEEKRILKTMNSQFKEKLEKKVKGKPGADKFIEKVFEADVRNDVELSPSEAKKLGIIKEIRKLEPKAYHGMQICALLDESKNTPKSSGAINNNNQKNKSMDLAQLQAEQPALYNQVFNLGEQSGAKKEKVRAQAWAVFNEIDPAKVKAGIEGDEAPNAKDIAEFNLAQMNGKKLTAMEKENPEKTEIKAEAKTPEQIQAEKDEAALNEEMGELKTY